MHNDCIAVTKNAIHTLNFDAAWNITEIQEEFQFFLETALN